MDDPVNAATHKHAAAFDVDRANGIREQHDGEDEPRCRFAHSLLGDAGYVVSRRTEIIQNDRRGSPEGNERKHDGARDNHLRRRPFSNSHSCSPFISVGPTVYLAFRPIRLTLRVTWRFALSGSR